jgi:hypothetical protein
MDLKQTFRLPVVKSFISLGDRITARNDSFVKNAIGANFSKQGLESIKLYYNWVHPLTRDEIEALHLYGHSESYYKNIQNLNENHFQPSLDYAYGVTFALKIDKHLRISMAHFTMPDLINDDPFFSHPLVKQYYKNHSELPVNNRKGVFHLIDEKGNEHSKDYYYVHHPALKELINADYGLDTNIVPVIEWAVGKGFYSGSDPSDEKIDLLLNYDEVFKKYGMDPEWKKMSEFSRTMWYDFKLNAYCPGFYKNREIRSIYYFNSENAANLQMNTIPKIVYG